jgi:hypothetical protein
MDIEPGSTWIAEFQPALDTLVLTNNSAIDGQVILRSDGRQPETLNISAAAAVHRGIAENTTVKNSGATLINAVLN